MFDVETTGLHPRGGDRITEIGGVETIDYLPTGRTFQRYVNPERDVPPKVQEITGLTTAFLRDKPLFHHVVDEFLDFVGDARMVAHNASFDRSFINMELERANRAVIADDRWVDTLDLARTMFPGSYNSLDALCKRFNISLEARDKHGALLDSQLLAAVYLELNGGRERSLDLTPAGQSALSAGAGIVAARRPQPLAPLSTAAEREAHAAFLATLGADPIWTLFGVEPLKDES